MAGGPGASCGGAAGSPCLTWGGEEEWMACLARALARCQQASLHGGQAAQALTPTCAVLPSFRKLRHNCQRPSSCPSASRRRAAAAAERRAMWRNVLPAIGAQRLLHDAGEGPGSRAGQLRHALAVPTARRRRRRSTALLPPRLCPASPRLPPFFPAPCSLPHAAVHAIAGAGRGAGVAGRRSSCAAPAHSLVLCTPRRSRATLDALDASPARSLRR